MNHAFTTEELVAFALGELNEPLAQRLRTLAASDASLATRLDLVKAMLATLQEGVLEAPSAAAATRAMAIMQSAPIAADWLDRLTQRVAEVIHDSLTASPAMGFRGEEESRHLSCVCGEARVDLLVDREGDADDPNAPVTIHGQITGTQPIEVAACTPDTTQVLASVAPEGGAFTLRVGPGESDLLIRTPREVVRIRRIAAR
jgi:AcrR family transcriptional regulator